MVHFSENFVCMDGTNKDVTRRLDNCDRQKEGKEPPETPATPVATSAGSLTSAQLPTPATPSSPASPPWSGSAGLKGKAKHNKKT